MRIPSAVPIGRLVGASIAVLCVPVVGQLLTIYGAGAATPPALSLSPNGNYTAGETIAVDVGPNGYFTPNAGIKIIECADPGGTAGNLPRDDSTCDGNTVQGGSVLVGSDGSFSEPAYTMYLLPSALLSEAGDNVPVCNQTHYCVLYVGQNQNDFTAPKTFSTPFLIAGGPPSTPRPTSTGTGGSSAASGGSSTTNPAVALAPSATAPTTNGGGGHAATSSTASGSLANTGPLPLLGWLVLSGLGLMLSGTVGRRMSLRRHR